MQKKDLWSFFIYILALYSSSNFKIVLLILFFWFKSFSHSPYIYLQNRFTSFLGHIFPTSLRLFLFILFPNPRYVFCLNILALSSDRRVVRAELKGRGVHNSGPAPIHLFHSRSPRCLTTDWVMTQIGGVYLPQLASSVVWGSGESAHTHLAIGPKSIIKKLDCFISLIPSISLCHCL